MQQIVLSTILVVMLGSVSVATAAEIDELLPECFACHGLHGVSQMPNTPTLAGLSSKTISQALLAFQNRQRRTATTELHRLLANSAPRIQALAEYFAQQNFPPARQAFDPKKAERGQLLHLDYCEKCHRANGTQDHLGCGILAGQQPGYLRDSLKAFFNGTRPASEKKTKRLAAFLAEQEPEAVEDLLHFYAYQSNQHNPQTSGNTQ